MSGTVIIIIVVVVLLVLAALQFRKRTRAAKTYPHRRRAEILRERAAAERADASSGDGNERAT